MSHGRARKQSDLDNVYELAASRSLERPLFGGYVHRPQRERDAMMDVRTSPMSSKQMAVLDRHVGAGQYGDAGMVGYGDESESDEEKPKKMKKEKKEMKEITKKHNKRAEIVRKVMKEQNLSMINASKYVKANNLY